MRNDRCSLLVYLYRCLLDDIVVSLHSVRHLFTGFAHLKKK